MRVYLRAKHASKLANRQRYGSRLVTAEKEITSSANANSFSLQNLRTARFRFQPHIRAAAPSNAPGSTA